MQGQTMTINIDPSEPEDSIDRYVMDTIVEGTEGAEPIYVPPHWHKVSRGSSDIPESKLLCLEVYS